MLVAFREAEWLFAGGAAGEPGELVMEEIKAAARRLNQGQVLEWNQAQGADSYFAFSLPLSHPCRLSETCLGLLAPMEVLLSRSSGRNVIRYPAMELPSGVSSIIPKACLREKSAERIRSEMMRFDGWHE